LKLFESARPVVPVAGTDEVFSVHRIYCVGQNYAAHAREMGSDPDREPPFYFMKPADAVVDSGATIPWPSRTENLHHEVELVVAIGKAGKDVAVVDAPAHIFGYAVGVDLTRRDLQAVAKAAGRPWDTAQGFDRSAPLSAIRRAADVGHPASGRIWLEVNDAIRQDGDLSQMIWRVPEAVAELSRYFELQAGDLLFTGTPAGVGPLKPGDRLAGGVEGVGEVRLEVAGG
jgi:fumarylpyruvate hydrolase